MNIMELNPSREITDSEILKYKPLVEIIANKFKNSGEPLEDLEQLGYIGLINAINLYNQQRKVLIG
jgi:RNA polymerase sigma-B factor